MRRKFDKNSRVICLASDNLREYYGWGESLNALNTEVSSLSPKFPFTVPHFEELCPFQKLSSPRVFPRTICMINYTEVLQKRKNPWVFQKGKLISEN